MVADRSPECRLALRFAARRAQRTRGHLSILSVLEPAEFQHWMAVEEVMKEEKRGDAISLLHDLAGEVNRLVGLIPEFVIREGKPRDEILALIQDEPDIRILVLGAAQGREPGPLVSGLLGGAIASFPIPVTIVPGDLKLEEIDELA